MFFFPPRWPYPGGVRPACYLSRFFPDLYHLRLLGFRGGRANWVRWRLWDWVVRNLFVCWLSFAINLYCKFMYWSVLVAGNPAFVLFHQVMLMQKIWISQAQVSHLLGWKNGRHPFHRLAEEFMHWQTSSPASFWKMQGRAARQIGSMSFKRRCRGRPNICVTLRWFLQSLGNKKRCGGPGGLRRVADHKWMNSIWTDFSESSEFHFVRFLHLFLSFAWLIARGIVIKSQKGGRSWPQIGSCSQAGRKSCLTWNIKMKQCFRLIFSVGVLWDKAASAWKRLCLGFPWRQGPSGDWPWLTSATCSPWRVPSCGLCFAEPRFWSLLCSCNARVQPSVPGCLASFFLCFSGMYSCNADISFKKWTGVLQLGGLWLCSPCTSLFSSHLSPQHLLYPLPEQSRSRLPKQFSWGFLKMTCISLHLPPARSGSFSQCVRVLCLSRTAKGKTRSWHTLSNEMHLVRTREHRVATICIFHHLSVLIDSTLRKWMLTEMASSAGRSSKTPWTMIVSWQRRRSLLGKVATLMFHKKSSEELHSRAKVSNPPCQTQLWVDFASPDQRLVIPSCRKGSYT